MQTNSHYMVTSCGRESCTCTGGSKRSKNDQDADGDAGGEEDEGVDLSPDEREALARELAMRTRFTLGQLADMRPGDLVKLAETFESASGQPLEALGAANATDDVDLVIDGYLASEELADSDVVDAPAPESGTHGSNVGDVLRDDGLIIDGYFTQNDGLAGLEGGD